ncbi:unnamed protein product [Microthlaspi erraticum]|uniref:FBD domain-containing protein n=1 Tax=Microthlaspi erraticum TaxID=1685480 RepID=A0A6D2I6T9_9BRAS|nr:unnamed protein product [Microthlaspi erraticum]
MYICLTVSYQVLEDLTIDNSITYRPRVIQVRSQTLKRIDISRCTYAVIDAPLLECLITKADQIKHYTITNSSFPAKLDIGVLSLFGQSEDVIRDILADIARVKDLVISSFLWKCMYQGLKSGAPLPPFRHLSCLNATFTIFDLEVLTTLLNNCPNLESLILELVKETSMFNMFRSDPKVKFSTVAGCLVSSLKFVELKSSISKYEIEMELVRYFLQNSPILEKLRVNSHYSGKAKSAILDQLLAMPRCSSACEILLLYTS